MKKKKNILTIEDQIQKTVAASEEMPKPEEWSELPSSSEAMEAVEEDIKEDALPQDLELVQVRSIIESILLAFDKPVNMSLLKEVFRGTATSTDLIKRALSDLMVEYAGAERGMTIAEVSGGYQLRTKSENQGFIRRLTKGRPFKLSGPSLEVLSIVSYKQPLIKSEIDSIRGVESGHLVRALMDRGLVKFLGKSELPGKPMLYGTTKKFLEIFGLRDLRELPSLSEIDELLPDGMLEEEKPEESEWGSIQDMSMRFQQDHQKHEEWEKITEEISKIETTTNFFEEEKKREKERRDQERAEGIREALLNGQDVSTKDQKWLQRYETQLAQALKAVVTETVEVVPTEAANSESFSGEAVVEAIAEENAAASESFEFIKVAENDETEEELPRKVTKLQAEKAPKSSEGKRDAGELLRAAKLAAMDFIEDEQPPEQEPDPETSV